MRETQGNRSEITIQTSAKAQDSGWGGFKRLRLENVFGSFLATDTLLDKHKLSEFRALGLNRKCWILCKEAGKSQPPRRRVHGVSHVQRHQAQQDLACFPGSSGGTTQMAEAQEASNYTVSAVEGARK